MNSKRIKTTIFFVLVLALFVLETASVYALDSLPNDDQLTDHVDVYFHAVANITIVDRTKLQQMQEQGIEIDSLPTKVVTVSSSIHLADPAADVDSTILPDVSAEAKKDDWSLTAMLASANYLYKKTTEADLSDIVTDFDSSTYKYLAIKNLKATSVTSNVSVIVSYADSLSANISDSADTTNTTIFNEPVITRHTYWWRLDLETTNSSRKSILNIDFTNAHGDAIYIFSMTTDMQDTRYRDIYLDNSDTPVSLSVLPGSEITTQSINYMNFLRKPYNYMMDYRNSMMRTLGWRTADDLEESLEKDWATQRSDIDTTSDILDYDVTSAKMSISIDPDTAATIYKDIRDKAETTDDVQEILTYLREKYFRTVTIATDLKPDEIDNIKEADDADEVSNGIIAAIQKSLGRVNIFAENVLDRIVDSTGHINNNVATWIAAKLDALESSGISSTVILLAIFAGAAIVILIVVRIGKAVF